MDDTNSCNPPNIAIVSNCACANRFGFLGGTTRPYVNKSPLVKYLLMTSRLPPTSVQTTGIPHKPASPTAKGNPSLKLELTKIHPLVKTFGAFPKPINDTFSCKLFAEIKALHSLTYVGSLSKLP